MQIVPSIMARNVTTVVQGVYGYLENLNKLVKEMAAAIVIVTLIFFSKLFNHTFSTCSFFVISFLYLKF